MAGAMSLAELSAEGVPEGVRSVAFVLSDNAPRPSFIRAVRAARELRSRASRPAVTVFAAEMAAYGTDELAYRQAQAEGVVFVRTSEPTVTTRPPKVMAVDQVTGLEVEVSPELLVAEEASEGNAEFITASPGGYAVLEGAPGRGAVSTMREGVSSPGPGDVRLDGEAVTGARAAATRALTIAMFPPDRASQAAIVDRERCAACLTCARVCPFGAAHPAEEGKASIDATLCQACGICVGACPARALSLPSYGGVPDKESAVLVEGRR
jgi:heterodisulfide reductase subunit A